jgi:hypothetical protein
MAAPQSLPVSGTWLLFREATGEDELVLLGHGHPAAETMLALVSRVATDRRGEEIPWLELPAVDLGAAALLIRAAWLGARISTDTNCPATSCGERIDVAFRIQDYLEHHRPRRFRSLTQDDGGWLGLAGTEVSFRIPTIGDLLASAREPDGVGWLTERCIRPGGAPGAVLRRIDRALGVIAPRLDGEVGGRCPACGHTVELFFEPLAYVLAELRDASAGLYGEVHELALAYHWPEQAILALARPRRQLYAEMVRGELALA